MGVILQIKDYFYSTGFIKGKQTTRIKFRKGLVASLNYNMNFLIDGEMILS